MLDGRLRLKTNRCWFDQCLAYPSTGLPEGPPPQQPRTIPTDFSAGQQHRCWLILELDMTGGTKIPKMTLRANFGRKENHVQALESQPRASGTPPWLLQGDVTGLARTIARSAMPIMAHDCRGL